VGRDEVATARASCDLRVPRLLVPPQQLLEAVPALLRVAELFALSPFETELLLAAAGFELDRALRALWPEGTPHLDPSDPTRVVIAGPNPAQRSATSN
jgi:hypothetical protein